MTGIIFDSTTKHCGCCGTRFFCAEGFHIQCDIETDGAKKHWTLIGSCDGSCQRDLDPAAEQLVAEFRSIASDPLIVARGNTAS